MSVIPCSCFLSACHVCVCVVLSHPRYASNTCRLLVDQVVRADPLLTPPRRGFIHSFIHLSERNSLEFTWLFPCRIVRKLAQICQSTSRTIRAAKTRRKLKGHSTRNSHVHFLSSSPSHFLSVPVCPAVGCQLQFFAAFLVGFRCFLMLAKASDKPQVTEGLMRFPICKTSCQRADALGCSDIIIINNIISRSSGSSSIRFLLSLSLSLSLFCFLFPFFAMRQSVVRFCAIFMEFSTHNRQIMPLIISGISIQSGADGFRFIFRRVRPPKTNPACVSGFLVQLN